MTTPLLSDKKKWSIKTDKLLVVQDASFNSTVDISGKATLNSALNVHGSTTLNDALSVDKKVSLYDELDVSGATKLHSTLEVTDATTLNNTLTVESDASFNSTVDVSGATKLHSCLEVTDAATLNDTLTVDKDASFNNTVDVSGATKLHSSLEVTDATTLRDSLTVEKDASFNRTVYVSGATKLHSSLEVEGDVSFNSNLLIKSIDGTTYYNVASELENGKQLVNGATHGIEQLLSTYLTTTSIDSIETFKSLINSFSIVNHNLSHLLLNMQRKICNLENTLYQRFPVCYYNISYSEITDSDLNNAKNTNGLYSNEMWQLCDIKCGDYESRNFIVDISNNSSDNRHLLVDYIPNPSTIWIGQNYDYRFFSSMIQIPVSDISSKNYISTGTTYGDNDCNNTDISFSEISGEDIITINFDISNQDISNSWISPDPIKISKNTIDCLSNINVVFQKIIEGVTFSVLEDTSTTLNLNVMLPARLQSDTADISNVYGNTDHAGTFSLLNNGDSTSGHIDLSGGGIIYTPGVDFNGPDNYIIQYNLDGLIKYSTIEFNVQPVNDVLEFAVSGNSNITYNTDISNAFYVTLDEDASFNISLNDLYNDNKDSNQNDVVTPSILSNPSNGSITYNSETKVLTYTPFDDKNNENTGLSYLDVITVTFNVSYDPSHNISDTSYNKEIYFSVTPVNDAPLIGYEFITTTNEDTDKVINLNKWTDVDINDSITYYIKDVVNGSVDVSMNTGFTNNSVTFTPTPNYVSEYRESADNTTLTHQGKHYVKSTLGEIIFYVEDMHRLKSSDVSYYIGIIGVNDPPTNSDLEIHTTKNVPVSFDLSGSDIDGDALTYYIVDVSNGTIDVSTNTDISSSNITFTPTPGFIGNTTLTYYVKDSDVSSNNISRVNISVNLPLLNDVLTDISGLTSEQLTSGSYDLGSFVMIQDVTQCYDLSTESLVTKSESLTLSNIESRYYTDYYNTRLSSYDYEQAGNPTDLTKWRQPYLDEDYKIYIDVSNNTWHITSDNSHNILSGIITNVSGCNKSVLQGSPIVQDAMIHFPEWLSGGGYRVVNINNGTNISYFYRSLCLNIVLNTHASISDTFGDGWHDTYLTITTNNVTLLNETVDNDDRKNVLTHSIQIEPDVVYRATHINDRSTMPDFISELRTHIGSIQGYTLYTYKVGGYIRNSGYRPNSFGPWDDTNAANALIEATRASGNEFDGFVDVYFYFTKKA